MATEQWTDGEYALDTPITARAVRNEITGRLAPKEETLPRGTLYRLYTDPTLEAAAGHARVMIVAEKPDEPRGNGFLYSVAIAELGPASTRWGS